MYNFFFLFFFIFLLKQLCFAEDSNLSIKFVDGKPYKHKHIMTCLNNQLKVERDNLGYLQNLETWINNHTWEKYENLDENDTRDTTTRITRPL